MVLVCGFVTNIILFGKWPECEREGVRVRLWHRIDYASMYFAQKTFSTERRMPVFVCEHVRELSVNEYKRERDRHRRIITNEFQ